MTLKKKCLKRLDPSVLRCKPLSFLAYKYLLKVPNLETAFQVSTKWNPKSGPIIERRQPFTFLKGTATLMVSMFNQKELYEPWILLQVSSKSVGKWASYGHLKIQYGKHLAAILNI